MPAWLIPLLLAGASGAQTAGNWRASSQAAGHNRRALEATERSDVRAEALERERLAEDRRALDAQLAEARREREERLAYEREQEARRERQYNEAVQRDRERWQEYLRLNEPHWRQGSGVLNSLYDLAGMGAAPEFQMPTRGEAGPSPSPTGVATGLPSGVPNTGAELPYLPPGSHRENAGINPDAWAYRTPAGRRVSGTRRRPTMPMMPLQEGGSGLSTIQSLLELANAMPETRVPLTGRNMGLSQLMTAPSVTMRRPAY